MKILRVGDKYPIAPPAEGFVARISGASFDCVGFAKNLSRNEIKQFNHNRLRYGIYETHLTPFFLIEIADSDWYFDIPLNLPAEKPEIRDGFAEGNRHPIGGHGENQRQVPRPTRPDGRRDR